MRIVETRRQGQAKSMYPRVHWPEVQCFYKLHCFASCGWCDWEVPGIEIRRNLHRGKFVENKKSRSSFLWAIATRFHRCFRPQFDRSRERLCSASLSPSLSQPVSVYLLSTAVVVVVVVGIQADLAGSPPLFTWSLVYCPHALSLNRSQLRICASGSIGWWDGIAGRYFILFFYPALSYKV